MPAWSFANESNGKLTMVFESLAFVGLGSDVEGRFIRSNREIARESDDRVGESYAALVLLGYVYGIATNAVQDAFFAIALGCCLGAALLSLESTAEAAPAAQRR